MKTASLRLLSPGLLALVSTLALTLPTHGQNAQDNESGNEGRRGPGGGRNWGNFDPEEMRKRMATAMREQFQVENEEEWALIYERINKVFELRRTTGGGFGGGMGGLMAMRGRGQGQEEGGGRRGPGMGGGFGGMMAQSSPETEALATAIRSNASPEDLKVRLEKVREARKSAEAKVAQAQEDLRSVLNVRQEAVAVLLGLLP